MATKISKFFNGDGYSVFVNGKIRSLREQDFFGLLCEIPQPYSVDDSLNDCVNEDDLSKFGEAGLSDLSGLLEFSKSRLSNDLERLKSERAVLENRFVKNREELVRKRKETLEKAEKFEKEGKILVTKCSLGSWRLFYLNDVAMYRKTTEDELLDELSGKMFEINEYQFDLGGNFDNDEYRSLKSALRMDEISYDGWMEESMDSEKEKIKAKISYAEERLDMVVRALESLS